MSEAFDFDTFIISPSQGDNTHSHDVREHNGPGPPLDHNKNSDTIPSFSDQGLDSNLGGGMVSSVSMEMMGATNLSSTDQMMYGSFGDPMNGDIMQHWDFGTAVGSLGGSNVISNHNTTFDPPLLPLSATNDAMLTATTAKLANGTAGIGRDSMNHASSICGSNNDMSDGGVAHLSLTMSDVNGGGGADSFKQAANDYRSSIAAHHSHLLTSGIGHATVSNVMQGVAAPSGPFSSGSHANGQAGQHRASHSAPAVRRSQANKRLANAPNSTKANLTLQERRRLSRRSAKQSIHATQAAANINVSGRGAKRCMDSNNEQISDSPQSMTNGSMSSGYMTGQTCAVSSPQKVARSKEASFAAPEESSSPVFTGQYSNAMGKVVSTANRYSSSGVDVLGILSRAITRPNPRVSLGPVDLSCSFTISDAHHPEQPLIYASETFCHLTGYKLDEILGRNSRFLQSPGSAIQQGSERQHTDNRAVEHLRRHLSSFRECQASLINYRKDGTPFINLVTVVPVSWSSPNQVDFLVGFQVDLVEQPGAILERKQDGSYVVNYRLINDPPHSTLCASGEYPAKDVSAKASKQAAIAQDILDLLHGNGPNQSKQWSRVLLENSHDLIYVLSLKGTFLYVSPSVERILGYTPEEVIGKSISEFCHPSDVVPVFRELKDSTSNASIAAAATRTLRTEGVVNPMTKGGGGQAGPKVNLILRMRHKQDGHCWIESTGKLHLEQGKGRKVVISSGRPRSVYNLAWEHVRRSAELREPSFWAKFSIDGVVLSMTGPIYEVLGCDSKDLSSRHLLEITNCEAAPSLLQALRSSQSMTVSHMMGDSSRNVTPVFTSFHPSSAAAGPALPTVFAHIQRASPESSWMMPNVAYPKGGPQPTFDATGTSVDSLTSVFAELSPYRSSSWVFEMHQLKNVNRKLKDEIRALRRQSKDHANMAMLPTFNLSQQCPTSTLSHRKAGHSEALQSMAPSMHIQAPSPIKRRPDHGHGHRQHLRPSPQSLYGVRGSSSTEGSSSASSEFSPFPEHPIEQRSGSGDASDETAVTTAISSGDTSEKDGSGSGSDTRQGSISEGIM